jgi:tRNA G37 N-methylase Trm5
LVIVTEQAAMMPLLEENIRRNGLGGRVHAGELDWTKPVSEEYKQADIVIAADCIYLESMFEPLCKALQSIVTHKTSHCFICYKKRRKADRRFFHILSQSFSFDLVDPRQVKMAWDDFEKQAVYIYRLTPKAPH